MPKSAGGKRPNKPPKSPRFKNQLQLECNKQSIKKKSTCKFNSIAEIFSEELKNDRRNKPRPSNRSKN